MSLPNNACKLCANFDAERYCDTGELKCLRTTVLRQKDDTLGVICLDRKYSGNWSVYGAYKEFVLIVKPSKDLDEVKDPCPEWGTELGHGHGGGVVCNKKGCGYWFCF